jgi:hypothetical protein
LSRFEITPTPSADEAAAITAVLEALMRAAPKELPKSRWLMAGRQYHDEADPKASRRKPR